MMGVHDVDGGGQGAAVRVPQLCVMWKISFYQCWPTVSCSVVRMDSSACLLPLTVAEINMSITLWLGWIVLPACYP